MDGVQSTVIMHIVCPLQGYTVVTTLGRPGNTFALQQTHSRKSQSLHAVLFGIHNIAQFEH